MTITKEGALASFYTVNKAPIKHLRVYFSPKQAGTGDPSPENVREISGWDGINLFHMNKNLFNPNYCVENEYIGFYNNNISETASSLSDIYKNVCWVQQGKRYTISYDIIGTPKSTNVRHSIITQDGIKVLQTIAFEHFQTGHNEQVFYAVFDGWLWVGVDKNCTNFQLEHGSVATSYEPYRGSTYNLDWSNDIGTVYGGYVDLVTGELVETHKKLICDGSIGFIYSTSGMVGQNITTLGGVEPDTTENQFYPINYVKSDIPVVGDEWIGYVRSGGIMIRVPKTEITSWQSWSNYLSEHPLEFVYKIATPITHQLSPTQLQTLLGRNNIWSNADRIEIEYDLAETNDELYRRRNIILRSAPHIVTPEPAALQHFSTDVAAPLKECKIHFSPVQTGSGDPSPSNVRTISGWTGLNITRCGKNLLDLATTADRQIWYNGSTTGWTTSYFRSDKIRVVPGLKYVGVTRDAGQNQYLFFDINKNYVSQTYKTGSNPVTIPDDIYYIGTQFLSEYKSTAQFEQAESPTSYEPYTGTTIPVDWTTEAGMVYGGYVDLVTGEVVKEYENVEVISSVTNIRNISYNSTHDITNISYFLANAFRKPKASGYVAYSTDGWCSHFPYEVNNYRSTPHAQASVNTLEITISGEFTKEAWLSYLENNGPIQLVYRIETPLTYQLTPSQLFTLRGQNNIWSNSNGPIELSYWTY